MELQKCCVPGCDGVKNLLKFPHPRTQLDRFKGWISFIGVKASEYSNNYQKIYSEYKGRRICELHFTHINEEGMTEILPVPYQFGPAYWEDRKKRHVAKFNKKVATAIKRTLRSIIKHRERTITIPSRPVIPGLFEYATTGNRRALRNRNVPNPNPSEVVVRVTKTRISANPSNQGTSNDTSQATPEMSRTEGGLLIPKTEPLDTPVRVKTEPSPSSGQGNSKSGVLLIPKTERMDIDTPVRVKTERSTRSRQARTPRTRSTENYPIPMLDILNPSMSRIVKMEGDIDNEIPEGESQGTRVMNIEIRSLDGDVLSEIDLDIANSDIIPQLLVEVNCSALTDADTAREINISVTPISTPQ